MITGTKIEYILWGIVGYIAFGFGLYRHIHGFTNWTGLFTSVCFLFLANAAIAEIVHMRKK